MWVLDARKTRDLKELCRKNPNEDVEEKKKLTEK
jgi:hypothetical protein